MKGKTNNPNGRPIGANGKVTQELKAWVKTILETNQAQFEADILEIEPLQRLQILTSLLKYSIPTIQSTELKTETLPTIIKIGYGDKDE
jgi:hypothetical protein